MATWYATALNNTEVTELNNAATVRAQPANSVVVTDAIAALWNAGTRLFNAAGTIRAMTQAEMDAADAGKDDPRAAFLAIQSAIQSQLAITVTAPDNLLAQAKAITNKISTDITGAAFTSAGFTIVKQRTALLAGLWLFTTRAGGIR